MSKRHDTTPKQKRKPKAKGGARSKDTPTQWRGGKAKKAEKVAGIKYYPFCKKDQRKPKN